MNKITKQLFEYGNNYKVIKPHYLSITKLKITSNELEFLATYPNIEKELRRLESMNENPEQNPLIISIIEKISGNIIISFKENRLQENSDMKTLREHTGNYYSIRNNNRVSIIAHKESYKHIPSYGINIIKCAFCDKNHFSMHVMSLKHIFIMLKLSDKIPITA